MRLPFLVLALSPSSLSALSPLTNPIRKPIRRRKIGGKADDRGIPELDKPLPNGVRFGTEVVQRYKVGVEVITAPVSPCAGVYATVRSLPIGRSSKLKLSRRIFLRGERR